MVSSGKLIEEVCEVVEEFEKDPERKVDRELSSQLLALELERIGYGSREGGGLRGGSPFVLEALYNLFRRKVYEKVIRSIILTSNQQLTRFIKICILFLI